MAYYTILLNYCYFEEKYCKAASIPNVSYWENVILFKTYYKQKKVKRRYVDVLFGQDILRGVERLFLNIQMFSWLVQYKNQIPCFHSFHTL